MSRGLVIAATASVGALTLAACGNDSGQAQPPSSASAPPTASMPPSTSPAQVSATLPISVQSDSQMQAAGNDGPSSSILAPTSCTLVGSVVTAKGGYTNGDFAPDVYNRYGDVVRLYVYTSPGTGDSPGVQIAQLGEEHPWPIGGYGTWQVRVPVTTSLGTPSSCVVVAQPTHAEQLAPS